MNASILDAFKIPEIRKRIFFTAGILLIYRFGVFVPTPGIEAEKLRRLFEQASGTLFGILNMFSGGALENFSVFALGVMPYISVSIIMQLLTYTFKPLEELQKEGEQGRRKITRYTRLGTLALSLVQGYFIAVGLESQGVVSEPGMAFRFITMITLSTGTMFIMWLGEQITERGIGNGMSIVIMSGILARMPATISTTLDLANSGEISYLSIWLLFAFGLGIVTLIIFVERCQRKIPVQYPRRAVGRQMTQSTTQHFPLKINNAGVMPPIFASTLLVFPGTIAQFTSNLPGFAWLGSIANFITPHSFNYEVLFAILIFVFCFFWTTLVFDPIKIAERLKKEGGFVPTVRPGKETADFIARVQSSMALWGGFYLCAVCIIPTHFYTRMGATSFTYFFGGTAVLIVVGVTLDTLSFLESHILSRNYETFMSKGLGKIHGASRKAQAGGRLIQR